MPILLPEELNRKHPKMRKVRQVFDIGSILNVGETVEQELSKTEIMSKIKHGMNIAIAVGSRGISHIDQIVKKSVEIFKKRGAIPFIVTAMGCHGGGTSEGQREILRGYGITEDRIGAPVLVDLDVVELGKTSFGNVVYTNRTAYEADMTVLINRVKLHTDFDGKGDIESGLCKMASIGLGNHIGCVSIHKVGLENFPEVLKEVASLVFSRSNIGFGIAIVENALEEPYLIEAVPVETILNREPELLRIAMMKMGKIQFPQIDILILEEIGKNISGTGADPNIIGRLGFKKDLKGIPKIKCIVVLNLSEKTHGNATGIGLADVTTKKVLKNMNFEITYANCLVGGSKLGMECAKLPFIMEDDNEAIAAALKIWGGEDTQNCRIVKIKNTMELEYIDVSQALWPYIEENPSLFEFVATDCV